MFNQSRTVCCIIYDIADLQLFIDNFQFADYEYAYIYHDKDKQEDGSLKPPHYHFYGHRKSPITEQSLKNFAKKCSQNIFYENLKSNDGALLRYFIHIDNEDKYHYEESEIIANFDIQSKLHNFQVEQKVDPADIVSMFEQGFNTYQIIKKYPKLLYSIASLQRFEKLVLFEKHKFDKIVSRRFSPEQIILVPTDEETPF